MPKLLIAFASAMLLLASSGIWKANAATITNAGILAPLTKCYAPVERLAMAPTMPPSLSPWLLWLWLRLPVLWLCLPSLPSLPVLWLRLQAIRLLWLRLALLRSSWPKGPTPKRRSPGRFTARASSALQGETMMAQGNHHRRLITTWHGLSNPDIEEAPTKAGWPTGASKAGSLCGGVRTLHAAMVLQRHGHAMGIQWATARIPAGCDLGATPRRSLLALTSPAC